jgi:hypothetical protein
LGLDLLSKNQIMESEVSIDSFSNFRTELRMDNKLEFKEIRNNSKYKATGILPLHQFNIFLTFNFGENSVLAYELNRP